MPIFRPKANSKSSRKPANAPPAGEIFSATVRDLASDGRGIASHPSGLTVFVPGVWPGESGRFRFLGMQNRLGRAELVELLEVSPERKNPRCPHHGFAAGDCGGCPWQFMSYPAQLAAKQARVEAALASFKPAALHPIWPSPQVYGYRKRAQLKTDGKQLGYLSAASHSLAAIEQCPILTAPNRQTLAGLIAQLPKREWESAARHRGRGKTREGDSWTSLNLDESTSASTVQVNQRLPFQQANDAQNAAMRDWLARHCEALDKQLSVLELFCGSGNFTRVLSAAGFESIVAVDGSGPATEALGREALPGVKVLTCDLFQAASFPTLLREAGQFSTLLLDPPRDGMRDVKQMLATSALPETIFYVSCNLATLQRDLAQLLPLGYRLKEVQPLDQAPHTAHVELLCVLKLKGNF